MSGLKFTGERHVPGSSPPRTEAEHLARYEFALKFVARRRTLDLGCGEGYGSHMLSRVAEYVVGSDIDSVAIEHAKATYSAPNLEYRVADAAGLPFSDHEFAACVCFEVIEHVKNPGAILREVARILKPDGVFIVSTPNGAVRVSSTPNPHHIKEYNLREFSELLEPSFPPAGWGTEIYGQFVRGKAYTTAGVYVKNAYLAVKGALGVPPPKTKAPKRAGDDGSKPTIEYDFRRDKAHLAEYLVAIITGRG